MELFKKLFWCTDQHFGKKGNDPVALKDNMDFFDWAIDEALTWGAETCILGGDLFDNRHQIGVITINAALDTLDKLSKSFKRVYILLGNHDLPYRSQRKMASVEFGRNYPNITIIREPTIIGESILLPWLMEDEYKTVKDLKGRYIFGHAEIPGFYFNSKILMEESEIAVQANDFNADYTFMGHFHGRQYKTTKNSNIIYTGNIFPSSFSDDGDDDKGIMLLEYGKEPSFKKWPGQPLYRSMKLSEMVSEPDKLLRQNMTVRVSIDLPLRYEEAQEIRDELIKVYSLRKIELINGTIEEQDFVDPDIKFRSVDQIIIEGLSDVDSAELNNQRLIDIYLSLPK
jgi:DNA repair exonuclease SbcCD nuclease subunit